ncbi:class F sortase [Shouchella shacheensis]|uniref:class F sortase n=1 Tax=Shouchella shacheensis TaxID=1649580 RepID=UPI000AF9254A|nr:sortase [Shouchella shacheensis]
MKRFSVMMITFILTVGILYVVSAETIVQQEEESPSDQPYNIERTEETDTPVVASEEEAPSDEFFMLDENDYDSEGSSEEETGIKPSTLKIPSLEINAAIEDVGILDNGQMGVPANEDDVAWFEPGVMPGEQGNAVFAGHVDGYTGPAVFFELEELQEGDEVIVEDEEGTELVFVVQRKESYDRLDAPMEEIFGSSDRQRLNLITCTGLFDRGAGTHEERLVVYTELKEEEKTTSQDPPSSPTNVEANGTLVTWHAVREEGIVGYRVYREDADGSQEHVASISTHERKSYTDPEADEFTYSVTAVDENGQESETASTQD